MSRYLSVTLALVATALSVAISVMSSEGAGTLSQQPLPLVGVLAVIFAHLLPALSREAGPWVRVLSWGVWVACMAFVGYVHTAFFLSSQYKAGERRSDTVTQAVTTQKPARTVSAILEEKVRVTSALQWAGALDCRDDCDRRRSRVAPLTARIQALEAEAEEARRWQAEQDRLQVLKHAQQVDPATAKLAQSLNVTEGDVSLVMGIVLAVVLDGSALVLWSLVFRRRDSMQPPMIADETAAVTLVVKDVGKLAEVDPEAAKALQPSKIDQLVARVRPEIEAGKLKGTVTSIRQSLGCAQSMASQVRQALIAEGVIPSAYR
ncbi:hypothetical protein [Rhodoferax sp. BAB1]|uniref:hypothetical protein n=1 Tax=Rhodoferax sp. BAB1 TaxID=2741720 RepID=UPI001576FFA1|nr:hypothetical protein [Rhodoferax sp. BAB1]QKO20779.1 hypothetical protein HTY51_02230 [Rhodoferax sp. BAB1]